LKAPLLAEFDFEIEGPYKSEISRNNNNNNNFNNKFSGSWYRDNFAYGHPLTISTK
jgi:hypothetical protein